MLEGHSEKWAPYMILLCFCVLCVISAMPVESRSTPTNTIFSCFRGQKSDMDMDGGEEYRKQLWWHKVLVRVGERMKIG